MSTAIGLVEAGLGIAILPESAFTADLERRDPGRRDPRAGAAARHRHPDAGRALALARRRSADRDAADGGARRSDGDEGDAEADVIGAALRLVAQAGAPIGRTRRDRSRPRRAGRASSCRRGSARPVTCTSGSTPPGSAAWYQSRHHSKTLPCMSCRPHGLARKLRTRVARPAAGPSDAAVQRRAVEVGVGAIERVAERRRGRRPGAAGVLPLRFGRQPAGPAGRQRARSRARSVKARQ